VDQPTRENIFARAPKVPTGAPIVDALSVVASLDPHVTVP
jgi:hypothetical protein